MKKVACLLVFLFAGTAHAAMIDFEEINNSGRYKFSGNSLDSQGFNFSNNSSGSAILHWGEFSRNNADPGGVTYSHNHRRTTTTLTKIGGDAFDLTSIDFGNVYNSRPYSQNFRVTGFYQGGGSTLQNITSDALSGLETFFFNWSGLSSVTWVETSGGYLQLDNIVVDSNIVENVPEPTTLVLLGLGLAGISFSRKQQTI